jgi:cobalt-zinc-cadmium efflux system outer membrane protein
MIAVLALGWTCAWAQRPSAAVTGADGRTVAELAALALERNGDLLAIRQQVAAAQGGLRQARLRPNPSVDLSGMRELRGPMNSFMVGGSIPLELFHRRDRRIEVAENGVTVARFDQEDLARRLRGEVESRFGEVLAAARNLRFTEDLLELNRKALELTQARAGQGAAPPLDADLLRVEVNRIDSMRADFEARLGVSVLELKSLVGLKPEQDLRLQGSLDPPPIAITQAEAATRALESRPDLRSLRAAEQMADAKVKQARAEGRLDANLTASYQRMDSGFPFSGLNAAGQPQRIQAIFNVATLGVSIALPSRNRNEGAIDTAVAELEAARRRREYAELIVEREVAAAFLARDKARESLEVYTKGVRDQAAQNLAVIRRVYELGRNQLLDVIAEQRRFIDVETGYTEALNRYYQASVRVRIAAALD